MKAIFLLFIILLNGFKSTATEAYREDFWLCFKIIDKSGNALSDIPVKFKIDSELKTMQTDEDGIVCICITWTSTDTRKNNINIWTKKKVKLLHDGNVLKCFKNWKKLFSENKMVTKTLLYENGILSLNKK